MNGITENQLYLEPDFNVSILFSDTTQAHRTIRVGAVSHVHPPVVALQHVCLELKHEVDTAFQKELEVAIRPF